MKNKRLLMFYSDNCEPCEIMDPLIKKLEKEHDLQVERLEVWYDQDNRMLLENYAGFSSVPFFYNESSGKKIFGEASYDELKKWALG